MDVDARRSPRKRVHLRVEFPRAQDFVEQYAENLSSGGVFVRGAEGLSQFEQVTIKLALPGLGAFELQAEVIHVIPRDQAGARGPGIGFAIRVAPPGFDDALTGYLVRLGNRANMTVFVDGEPWRELVSDAGYHVAAVPDAPGELASVIARESSVAGVLVPTNEAADYAAALAGAGKDMLVIAVDGSTSVEAVLDRLDGALAPA